MALYQSKGTISEMSEVQSGTSQNGYQWQRMTIIMDIPGFQGSIIKQAIQVTGDDVNEVLLYNIGDRVEVSWSLHARNWNGKWYNNVELVKIKSQEETKQDAPEQTPALRSLNNIPAVELEPQEEDLPW